MKQSNGSPEDVKVFGITIKKASANGGNATGKKAKNAIDPETFAFVPKIPKVNVIPAELTQKYEVKGVLRKSGFVLVGIAALFGLVFAGGTYYNSTLNSQFEAKVAEKNNLTAQVQSLGPYQDYKTAVDSKRQSLSQEVSTDINFGTIYSSILDVARDNNVNITSMSVTQSAGGTAESACINPDPFDTSSSGEIGCITFDATASSSEDADQFADGLLNIDNKAFVKSFISSVSNSDAEPVDGQATDPTTFQGTVAFTAANYSGKYAKLALPLEDLVSTTNSTEGQDVSGGEIENVVFQSAVTNQALTLVPDLAEENLSEIDGYAVAACQPEGDVTTALASIKSVLIQRLPADDTTIDSVVAQLEPTLTSECEGE